MAQRKKPSQVEAQNEEVAAVDNSGEEKKEKKVKYRKLGGGTFFTKTGEQIVKDQVFKCHPSDIPKGFRDLFAEVKDED